MHVSHHHDRSRQRKGRAPGEHGYVLVMFALLLVPLLLFVGLAVDVGSWYNRASEIQRAADAAALAGVIWLPDEATARTYALQAAARNGFVDGVNNVTITVIKVADNDRRLRVTITDSKVPSFLWQTAGGKSINLTRKATGEYVLPVPLGSPDNRMGNDPLASPAYTPNLWASISGPYTDKNNGDPYSTKCGNGSSGTGCSQTNGEYRNTGYVFVVDVPAASVGQTLTLSVYDAGNYPRANYPNVETADNGTVNTQFEFFRADNTPLSLADNETSVNSMSGKCSTGPGKQYIADSASASTYENKWFTLCQVTADMAGQWVLQVRSSGITGVTDAGNGWNQYSLKATLSGSTQPALYAVTDLSLFNNLPGLTGTFNATFYLSELKPSNAGKTFRVSLFDPGDGPASDTASTYKVNILQPGAATTGCTYRIRGASTGTTLTTCQITTRTGGVNAYNGLWLDIDMTIPTTYACTTDCWWKVKYDFNNITSGNSPNDRTVWAARVLGDPVHLVEE
ncbi:MAG: hypothetical protein JWN46_2091 [Acidimicrobiales bacterium]|nr:hypothetical protein [Acidimicrobiales bacterium]